MAGDAEGRVEGMKERKRIEDLIKERLLTSAPTPWSCSPVNNRKNPKRGPATQPFRKVAAGFQESKERRSKMDVNHKPRRSAETPSRDLYHLLESALQSG